MRCGAGNSEGLSKWQLDKLVNWVTVNDYSTSPDWYAIDELVESTGLKPSEVVACIEKLAGCAAMCRKSVEVQKDPDVIIIDDDEEEEKDEDGVPELADEKDGDAWNVLVADAEEETPIAKPLSVSRDESESKGPEEKVDTVIAIDTELGVDLKLPYGNSNSFESVQV